MDSLNIYSWNVNGIRAIHRKGFLDFFNEDDFDILCLQETKAHIDQLPKKLINVEGYNSYFNSAERKGYSGVAMYSSVEPKEIKNGFGLEKFDNEGRVQIAKFDDFLLFNIYFPNGGASIERLEYKLEFYDVFLRYINNLRDEGNNIIVCGDLNTAHNEIDIARPKENSNVSGFLPVEREWVSKFLSNGYIDTFRELNPNEQKYSWWSYRTKARERNVGWRLDYFFVNEEFLPRVEKSFILSDVMGSDHCPIGITVKL